MKLSIFLVAVYWEGKDGEVEILQAPKYIFGKSKTFIYQNTLGAIDEKYKGDEGDLEVIVKKL